MPGHGRSALQRHPARRCIPCYGNATRPTPLPRAAVGPRRPGTFPLLWGLAGTVPSIHCTSSPASGPSLLLPHQGFIPRSLRLHRAVVLHDNRLSLSMDTQLGLDSGIVSSRLLRSNSHFDETWGCHTLLCRRKGMQVEWGQFQFNLGSVIFNITDCLIGLGKGGGGGLLFLLFARLAWLWRVPYHLTAIEVILLLPKRNKKQSPTVSPVPAPSGFR